MPNWVDNVLIIKGPSDRLAELKEAVKGTDPEGHPSLFSLQSILPIPDNLSSDDVEERWGTVCDVFTHYLSTKETPRTWTVFFHTKWSPPDKIVEKLAADYPDLMFSFRYNEPLGGFSGWAKYENGVLVGGANSF